MTSLPESPNRNGLLSIAGRLLATLRQEEETLARLHETFNDQIEALRRHRHEVLESSTAQVNEAVHAMEGLRKARERQARLLGRLLGLEAGDVSIEGLATALENLPDAAGQAQRLREARGRIHERARQTRQRCEEFEFALQYAVKLGREMLQVMQDLDVPPPARIYTASGDATQTAQPRSLVNKMG